MSHSVSVRTTTTTSGTAIILNVGYLASFPGILKFIEVALGITCVGLAAHDFNLYSAYGTTTKLFFLLMVTTFMIGSVILLLSCLASSSTGSIISKTIYEVIYHAIGFGLLLAASITLLVEVSRHKRSYYNYEAMLAASIMGLVNAALYIVTTVIALRSYKGF